MRPVSDATCLVSLFDFDILCTVWVPPKNDALVLGVRLAKFPLWAHHHLWDLAGEGRRESSQGELLVVLGQQLLAADLCQSVCTSNQDHLHIVRALEDAGRYSRQIAVKAAFLPQLAPPIASYSHYDKIVVVVVLQG